MEKLRTAIIGAGGISRGHAKRLLGNPEVDLAALVEPSADALERFKQTVWPEGPPETGAPKVFKDHKSLLADEKLDAALVMTPHTLHFGQIMDCLDAGLHVLAEKPLVCSYAENLKVIEKAKEAGTHVVLSYQRRFSPVYRHMRRLIHSAEFGTPLTVASYLSQGWLIGCAGKWRQDPKLSGGGQLHDSGSHIIDMVMWMLDEDVDVVTALIDNRGTRVDIDSAVSYRTVGGTIGTLTIAGSGPTKAFWEDMTITSDNGHALFLRKGQLQMTRGHGTALEPVSAFDEKGTDPDTHFVDVIRGREQNASPPEDFLRVIGFTEACWASAAEGGAPAKVRRTSVGTQA